MNNQATTGQSSSDELAGMRDKRGASGAPEREDGQVSQIHNAHLQRRIHILTRERELLAYEIHDGLLQELTAASLLLEEVLREQKRNPKRASESLDAARERVRRGIDEGRGLLTGLQPPILESGGIVRAARFLVSVCEEESGAKVELLCAGEFDRKERETECTVFRIIQEALNNVAQHSNSTKARVRLTQTAKKMTVEVEDWGVGFDVKQERAGCFGLKGIRERARLLGGHATIDSNPGNGTRIRAELPLVSQTASDALGGAFAHD